MTHTTTITFGFDGTSCEIRPRGGSDLGYWVTVSEGKMSVTLYTLDGANLYMRACEAVEGSVHMASQPSHYALDRAFADKVKKDLLWKCDRICYVFELARKRFARGLDRRN